MNRPCDHPDFSITAQTNRWSRSEGGPVTGYNVELSITCKACRCRFEFVGLPAGVSPVQPTVSPDALELRAPIVPAGTLATMVSPQRTVS